MFMKANCYINGDVARYTGSKEVKHYATWFEVKMMDGHESGKLKVTSECPDCGLNYWNDQPAANVCQTCEVPYEQQKH